MTIQRSVKLIRSMSILGIAAAAVSCTSAPQTTEAPVAAAPRAPATQGDVARLEQENADLRAQVQKLSGNDPIVRQAVADVKLDQHKILPNKLEPGMTLEETNAVVTGHGTVYSNLCSKIDETDTEVTYLILSNDQKTGPGSGGAVSSPAVNMRGERATPKTRWTCVFDKSTGKLLRYSRG